MTLQEVNLILSLGSTPHLDLLHRASIFYTQYIPNEEVLKLEIVRKNVMALPFRAKKASHAHTHHARFTFLAEASQILSQSCSLHLAAHVGRLAVQVCALSEILAC